MKCPACHRNHKHSQGMTCVCGRRFILDPKTHSGWTDGKFLAVLRKASANGVHYCTENQFRGAFCHLTRKKQRKAIGCLTVVFGVMSAGFVFLNLLERGFSGPAIAAAVFIAAALLFGGFLLAVGVVRKYGAPDPERCDSGLSAWKRGGGDVERLIDTPRLSAPPPEWKEGDIYDYGVERILVVDNDLLVDLFVLNQFHAWERALVLSSTGYPAYLVSQAQRLVEERPDLPVFFLHDSGKTVESMRRQLSSSGLGFLASHRAGKNLGLDPADIPLIPKLRPILPRKRDPAESVPVDYLAFGTLAAMAAQGMTLDQTFQEVLLAGGPGSARPHDAGGDGGSGYG